MLFRQQLDEARRCEFDDWYACGASEGLASWVDERASGAPAEAARRWKAFLRCTAYAGRLPTELSA